MFLVVMLAILIDAESCACDSNIDAKMNEFIATAVKGPQERASANRAGWEVAVEWRLEMNRRFGELLAAAPDTSATRLCHEFETCTPLEATNLALACSPMFMLDFMEFPDVNDPRASYLKQREVLRKAQLSRFVDSKAFRERYVHLCLWESVCLGHFSTNEHFSADVRVDCPRLVESAAQYSVIDKNGERYQEFRSSCDLSAAFLFAITSREDLLRGGVEEGIAGSVKFSEWLVWLKTSKDLLVQRRDYCGWTKVDPKQIDDAQAPGLYLTFPEFLLCSVPISGVPRVDPEIRRSFRY